MCKFVYGRQSNRERRPPLIREQVVLPSRASYCHLYGYCFTCPVAHTAWHLSVQLSAQLCLSLYPGSCSCSARSIKIHVHQFGCDVILISALPHEIVKAPRITINDNNNSGTNNKTEHTLFSQASHAIRHEMSINCTAAASDGFLLIFFLACLRGGRQCC